VCAMWWAQDDWEARRIPAVQLVDVRNTSFRTTNMSLWYLGNAYLAAGREVVLNHERMAARERLLFNDSDLAHNRFWQFVVSNGPAAMYEGYRQAMDSLVRRAMEEVVAVNGVNWALLIVEVTPPPAPCPHVLCRRAPWPQSHACLTVLYRSSSPADDSQEP
jgi:hypothetical protein